MEEESSEQMEDDDDYYDDYYDYDYDDDISEMSSEDLIDLLNKKQKKYYISSQIGVISNNKLFVGTLRRYKPIEQNNDFKNKQTIENNNNKDENINSDTNNSNGNPKNGDHDTSDNNDKDQINSNEKVETPKQVSPEEIKNYFNEKDAFAIKLFNLRNNKKLRKFDKEQKLLNLFSDTDPVIKYKDLICVELNERKKCLLAVMNLYLNGSLFDFIWRVSFSLTSDIIKLITYKCILILKLLKSKQIVHNDFKMDNFLVTETEPLDFYATDFEFAQYVDKNGNSNCFGGTDVYKSPEVLDKKKHSYSSDMWSLGVQIYYMLNNCYPFDIVITDDEEDDAFTILEKIKTRSIKRSEMVSDDAFECVSKMLKINPNDRITPEDALKLEWFKDIHKDAIKEATSNKLDDSANIDSEIHFG